MVVVDSYRCSYCGGCVSVCPVDALTLAETRLMVNANCIDCGNCVLACPMGALQPQDAEHPAQLCQVQPEYDLVVVGAGPGGATAAQVAAQAGLSVLLLEKRQEIGSPVRCAEGVGHNQLASFVEPDPRWISAEVNQAEITCVVDGARRTMRAGGGRGYVLERRVFDRALAERAVQAGAQVRVKTAVTGLLIENGHVRGVKIRCGDLYTGPDDVQVQAKVVIAADGIESQVGRWAGLDVQLALEDTMVCAQYLLAGVKIDPTCTCYMISHKIAPGGYAWIFPKGEGRANVGLGVQANLPAQAGEPERPAEASQVRTKTAMNYLNCFIENHPALAQGYPVTLIAANVPVALSPSRIVTDGLMLVGDAARQVDPLTGGGITNAMMAGKLAAQAAVEAIASGDTSATFLRRYEEQWLASTGRKLQRNYRLRQRFPSPRRTDEHFVRAFALATK